METEYKTLRELDVKPGDVVEYRSDKRRFKIASEGHLTSEDGHTFYYHPWSSWSAFKVVSRAHRDDTPKLWRDMTDAEQGALLLAHHRGKVIQCWHETDPKWEVTNVPSWFDSFGYRVRPEPKVETVTLKWAKQGFIYDDEWQITFNLIDGKPDVSSTKMEEL